MPDRTSISSPGDGTVPVTGTVLVTGAVLEQIGAPPPYGRSRPISVSDLEITPPREGELLVRIEAAGLCHSDLSVVDGNRVRPVPMLLGHEAAGRIEATGPTGSDLAVGQRVVMTFLPRCGDCAECRTDGTLPCARGTTANNAGTLLEGDRRLSRSGTPVNHHMGVSGFATRAVVDRRSVVPLDEDVPPTVAALFGCAVLTGGGAVLNAGCPGPGEDVLVVGLGGVGLAALLTARALGQGRIIGVDTVPGKLALARELGADTVLTPDEAVDRRTQAPVVVEAAGDPRAFETAVALTGPGGRTVTVGLPAPTARAQIAPLGITAEARSIVGSYLGSAVPSRDIPRLVALWRQGRLPVEKLVSDTIRLVDINAAMDKLAAGTAVRQMIVFDDPARSPAARGTTDAQEAS